MKRLKWVYFGLFALGIGLPMAAGYFSKGVSKGEGAKVPLRFPQEAGVKTAIVDLARFGAVKGTLQPWRIRIYVRVENAGAIPRRVRIVQEGCPLPINWHARDYTWNAEHRALEEPLPAGKRFGVYLFVTVPEELREQGRLCDGILRALDDDTGELLATSRLQIIDSRHEGLDPQLSEGHEGGHHHDGALHN